MPKTTSRCPITGEAKSRRHLVAPSLWSTLNKDAKSVLLRATRGAIGVNQQSLRIPWTPAMRRILLQLSGWKEFSAKNCKHVESIALLAKEAGYAGTKTFPHSA